MKAYGTKAFQFGRYEFRRLLASVEPIVVTAALTYATSYVSALKEAGGWRALLAVVIAGGWTAGRQYFADNSKDVMQWILRG